MSEEQCDYGYTGSNGISWRCMRPKHGPKVLPASTGSPEREIPNHYMLSTKYTG